jgi:hypothetical protein
MPSYPNYKPRKLPTVKAGETFSTANPVVPDVMKAYRAIETQGDYLRVHDGGQFPEMRYTASVDNDVGLNNHFQGLQRLGRGKYLVISGGDTHSNANFKRCSHVFVVKMGSRLAGSSWGSNIVQRRIPPANDSVVQTIGIDGRLWHAGGMSIVGDILAVPVESFAPERSRIVFFNLRVPEKPKQFPHTIERMRAKAGAVAMTRLANEHYLLAVWSDSDAKPKRLDIYLSKSTDFMDGFHNAPVTWYHTDVLAIGGLEPNFSDFQTVNFVTQEDGRLFLAGLHNTSGQAPTVPGRDYVDLFEVGLPDSLTGSDPVLGVPAITKVAKQQFFCNDQQANMDSAAGVYIDGNGRMNVYAAWHWRSDNLIRFTEFRPRLDKRAAPVTDPKQGWVDLYEHTGYRGRRLSIIGNRKDTSIPHYGSILVQGSGFEDKVSSVRFQLPRGVRYTLYQDRYFEGRAYHLKGTGDVEEIRSLHLLPRFGDKVSSSRYTS